MVSRCHPFGAGGTLLLLLLAAAPPPLAAQSGEGRPLSLREALERAPASSEQLDIARAGVTRARGDQLRARSAGLPQINGSAGYSRALQSQFQGLGGAPDTTAGPPPPACGPFTPNPGLPLGERVDSLERAAECAARGGTPFGGLDFGNLGFGAENTFNFGASLAQPLFTGGRVTAQNRIARAGREVAEIGVESARAQVALDVTQAYWDAALSDRLVTIAQASLEQAEETLRLTELARRVGNLSEFELLRARVARDNQRPVLIQRVTERDLAYLRLKQLLELPLDEPLALSDALEGAAAGPTPDLADTLSAARAPVRQAAEGVRVQEGQLRIARAQRLPAINLVSQYGRVAYTTGAGIPAFNSFRANWTIGAALQIPIFTGGRIRGDEL
ncbi:MAG: TolC family protein, partial [Gemmatimonadota bacterium]|nr:TolC family protein [Gemmatimonadota bacterium]